MRELPFYRSPCARSLRCRCGLAERGRESTRQLRDLCDPYNAKNTTVPEEEAYEHLDEQCHRHGKLRADPDSVASWAAAPPNNDESDDLDNTAGGSSALANNTTGRSNTADGFATAFGQHHRQQQHRHRLCGACGNTTGDSNTATGFATLVRTPPATATPPPALPRLWATPPATATPPPALPRLLRTRSARTTPPWDTARSQQHHGDDQHGAGQRFSAKQYDRVPKYCHGCRRPPGQHHRRLQHRHGSGCAQVKYHGEFEHGPGD